MFGSDLINRYVKRLINQTKSFKRFWFENPIVMVMAGLLMLLCVIYMVWLLIK